jgi:hypothetical protein
MTKAEHFRKKGTSILRDKPDGIGDFLNDSSLRDENTHLHSSTEPQFHKINVPKEELGRLHVQIRKGLMDKLMEIVYKRKANPKTKKKNATQRAIIEEALEMLFDTMAPDSSPAESRGNNFDIENNWGKPENVSE